MHGAWFLALLLLVGLCPPARALVDTLADQADGHLDASRWMLEGKGFLPVPIVITEPAVGYGGGVALMFLRRPQVADASKDEEGAGVASPDVLVVGAAATRNGTKAAFVGGTTRFEEGRWRYRGGVGRADIKLEFYGVGSAGVGGGARSLHYALDGWASSQQVLRRLGDNGNWFGLRWIFMDLDSKVDLSADPRAGLRPQEGTRRVSGLGFSLEHDSRDSIFTPSNGWTGALEATFYDPKWGSGTRFQTYTGHVLAYRELSKDVVLGARLDGRSVSGRPPFYMLPFIDLRGVPAGRYQDEHVAVAEAELRWNFVPGWALIGFAGAGRAWGRGTSFGAAPSAVSKGLGVRYRLAQKLGLWVGLDYARGPGGAVTYIQVGSAWR